jgi:peptidoglycan L-alanyl-D-glutamate endopeptidase CwlK
MVALLWEMKTIKEPVQVVEGYRSPARQLALYAQGRTKPGKIVTWVKSSMHTQGRACDICALKNGRLDWSTKNPAWSEFGHRAERRGLRWGGRWKAQDLGHVELPYGVT